jgi:hypothetical protein
MMARLGNALFWICILLAAFWVGMAVQHKDDVTTYGILGGIMLLVSGALCYILSHDAASEPSDEHVASDDITHDAMAGYGELTTALKELSHRLNVIESQFQQKGSQHNSVQGERISLDAATLCNRALVLEQKGLKTAATTYYKEALLLDPANEDAIAALDRLQQ